MIRQYNYTEQPQYHVSPSTPRTSVPVITQMNRGPMCNTPYYQTQPNYITSTSAMNNQAATAIVTQLPPIQSLTHNLMQQQQPLQPNVVSRGSGSVSPVGMYTQQHMLRVPVEDKERRNSINIGTLCQETEDNSSKNNLPTPSDSTAPTSRKSSISSDLPVYNNGEKYNENGELIGKTGKPLRNTKRAAQNRSAQKAFRQRREKYIKALEEKARQYDSLLKENLELKNMVESLKQGRPVSANMITK
ncbi:hypothetical protein RNJ44_01398 [Nakaseomyces bracarensis]|uniref:Putative transcription factor kapC n=1 Tax=Nakaseomyces bracarensis TaxID=273131 RepID=A0ABR4NPL6_9SACH